MHTPSDSPRTKITYFRSLLELGGKPTNPRNSSCRELDNICSLVKVRPFSNTYLDEEYNALEYYKFMNEGKRGWKKTYEHVDEAAVKCYPKITTHELKFREISSVSSEGSIATIKIPDSGKDAGSNFEASEEKDIMLSRSSALLSFNAVKTVRKKPSQHTLHQSGALALRLSPCSNPAVSETHQDTDEIKNMINNKTVSTKPVKKRAIKSIRIVLPRTNDVAKDLTESSTFSNTFNGYKISQNRRKNAKALSTTIPEWKRKLTLPMVTMNKETKCDKSYIQIQFSKAVDKSSCQRPTAKIVEIPSVPCLTIRPAKEVGGLRGKKTLTSKHLKQKSYGVFTKNDEFFPAVRQCFKHDAMTDEDSQKNLRLRYVRR